MVVTIVGNGAIKSPVADSQDCPIRHAEAKRNAEPAMKVLLLLLVETHQSDLKVMPDTGNEGVQNFVTERSFRKIIESCFKFFESINIFSLSKNR